MTVTVAPLTEERSIVTRALVEPAAFASIYDHYFPRVYTYIRYRIRDASLADDLAAQVFEHALRRLGDFRVDGGPFAAWLFAIARNRVSDHRRSQKRRWLLTLGLSGDGADPRPSADDAMIQAERRVALTNAISRLNERERDLIGLKFAGGLGNKDIAELTGLSESNVGVIVFRALKRLRECLSSEGVKA